MPKQPQFGTFDRNADIKITERNLPHWFQPGSAIFVTFRTADSLPKDVLLRWQRELEEWLTAQGLPLQLAESTVHRASPVETPRLPTRRTIRHTMA